MCVDQRAGVQKGSAAMIGLWTTLVVPRVKMCRCVVVMGESGAGLAEKMAVPTGSSEPPVWYRVCVCVCGKQGLSAL